MKLLGNQYFCRSISKSMHTDVTKIIEDQVICFWTKSTKNITFFQTPPESGLEHGTVFIKQIGLQSSPHSFLTCNWLLQSIAYFSYGAVLVIRKYGCAYMFNEHRQKYPLRCSVIKHCMHTVRMAQKVKKPIYTTYKVLQLACHPLVFKGEHRGR